MIDMQGVLGDTRGRTKGGGGGTDTLQAAVRDVTAFLDSFESVFFKQLALSALRGIPSHSLVCLQRCLAIRAFSPSSAGWGRSVGEMGRLSASAVLPGSRPWHPILLVTPRMFPKRGSFFSLFNASYSPSLILVLLIKGAAVGDI